MHAVLQQPDLGVHPVKSAVYLLKPLIHLLKPLIHLLEPALKNVPDVPTGPRHVGDVPVDAPVLLDVFDHRVQ